MAETPPFLPRQQGSLTPAEEDADSSSSDAEDQHPSQAATTASCTSFIPPLSEAPFSVPLNDTDDSERAVTSETFPIETEGAEWEALQHQDMDSTLHVSNRGRDNSPRPPLEDSLDDYAEWNSSSSSSSTASSESFSSDHSSSTEPLPPSSSSSSDSPPPRQQQRALAPPQTSQSQQTSLPKQRRSKSLQNYRKRRSPSPGLPTVTEFQRSSFEIEDEILLEGIRQQRSRSADSIEAVLDSDNKSQRNRRAAKGSKAELSSERSRINAAAAEILRASPTRRRRTSSAKTSSPNESPTRNQRRSRQQRGWRSNSSEAFPKDMPLVSGKGGRRHMMVKSNSSPSLLRYQDNAAPNRDVPPPPPIRGESPRTQTVKKHALQNALHGLEEELYQLAAQDVAWPKPMTPKQQQRTKKRLSSSSSSPKVSPRSSPKTASPNTIRKMRTPRSPRVASPKSSPNSLRKRSPVPRAANPRSSPSSLRKRSPAPRSPKMSPAASPSSLRKTVASPNSLRKRSPAPKPKHVGGAPSRTRSPVPKPPMTGGAAPRKQRSPVPKPQQKNKHTPPSMRNNLAYPSRTAFDLSSSNHSDHGDERKSKSKNSHSKSKQRNSTASLTSDFQNRLTLRRHHSGNTVEQILGLASTITSESANELTALNTESDPNDHKLPFRTRSFDSPRGRKSRLSSEIAELQQDYLEKWYGGGSPPSSSNAKIPNKGIEKTTVVADPPPRSPMRKTSPIPPYQTRKAPLPPPSVEDVEWD